VIHRPRVRRLTETEVDRYDLVPRRVARRAVLVRVPLLPPGALGMTSGRFVLLRRDEPFDGSSQLIAHELVHVRQFADAGRLLFVVRYLAAYAVNLFRLRDHHRAYRAIPAEREAYTAAATWAATRAERARAGGPTVPDRTPGTRLDSAVN
jgi:hypothetical protein